MHRPSVLASFIVLFVLNLTLSAAAQRERDDARLDSRRVQEALIWTGHYDGTVDGRLGGAVRRSIAAFQRDRGVRPTGVLREDGARLLMAQAREQRTKAGFTFHDDAKTGIKLGLPLKLVRPAGETEHGSRFVSPEGGFEIELFRFGPGERGMERLYESARGGPARRVTYAPFKSTWFVVSGHEAGRQFYTRARQDKSGVAAFAVAYDDALDKVVEPIIVAMSNSFADPDRVTMALDTGSPPPAEAKVRERHGPAPAQPIAAAFPVSREGHFLTVARVTTCPALSLGDGRLATLAGFDRRNDLALLKTDGGATDPLAFARGPLTVGDAVTAAPADAAKVSTGGIVALSGGDGDTSHLEVELEPGIVEGGAPLLDNDGSIVGVLAAMEREAAARRGEPETQLALKSEMAKMFLAAHGLDPVLGAVATQDVAARARQATLPVWCDAAGERSATSTTR